MYSTYITNTVHWVEATTIMIQT